MSDQMMIGFCGLVCSRCEGYLSSQANDEEWKERLAAHARDAYGDAGATVASVTCDGCRSGGRLCSYCSVCEIRACAVEKGVEHCGACAEFDSCQRIQKFIEMVPETRETFALLRGSL